MLSVRKLTSLLIVMLMMASCAVKPDEKVAHGQDHNLFKKSDLLAVQLDHVAGADALMLTGSTKLAREYPSSAQVLIKNSTEDLPSEVSISFDISESYLTVYKGTAGKKTPLKQFSIKGHYDLAPQTNADGVESHVLVRNTTKSPLWQKREYIEVDPFDALAIKASEDALKNLYGVDEMTDKKIVFAGPESLPFMRAQDVAKLVKSGMLATGMNLKVVLSESYLTIVGENDVIIAQASISYVDLVRRKNSNDELTPDLIRDSDDNPWEARAYLSVDPTSFTVREFTKGLMENLHAKSKFDGDFNGLAAVPVAGKKLASMEILSKHLDSKLTVLVTLSALEIKSGSETIATIPVLGHYDIANDETDDGEKLVDLFLSVEQNAWDGRAYVMFDLQSIDVPSAAAKSFAKSDMTEDCMAVSEMPLTEMRDAVVASGKAADDSVCIDIRQTIVSVSDESGQLLMTFDVIEHYDIGSNHPNWEKRAFVSVAAGNPQKMESLVGDNALSKDKFAGEFLYTATVMDVHSENGLFYPGANVQSGDRLRFEFSKNNVTLYKVNEKLNDSSVPSPVLRFHADQFDVKRMENYYGDPTNVIAEDRKADWQLRQHARVDFASNQIPSYFTDMFGIVGLYQGLVFQAQSRMVDNIKIEDGYISYETEEIMTPNARAGFIGSGETIAEPVAMRIKHVFMRMNDSVYTAKEYNDYDFQRFGFFRTTDAGVDADHRKTDGTLKHYIRRFDVSGDKTIDYYLSANFPEKYKDEMQEVVDAWNVAFKAATGRDEVMVLHEGQDKDHGDPRVNMIVYVDGYRSRAPLGFGPSVFDPNTGRNISGKAYIYDNGIRYMKYAAGLYYDLVTGEKSLLDFTREPHRPITGAENGFETDLRILAMPRSKSQAENKIAAMGGGEAMQITGVIDRLRTVGISLDRKVLEGELPQAMTSNVKKMDLAIAKVKDEFFHGQTGCNMEVDEHIASALKFVQAYAHLSKEELLAELESRMIFNLTLHEVGHNLGLRHNFHGSFDESNFPAEYHTLNALGQFGLPDPIGEGEWIYKYRGSSVMDYNDDYEALYKSAGPYDIAAIKYGYGDKMEVVIGQDQFGAVQTKDIDRKEYLEVVEEMRQQMPDEPRFAWEFYADREMGVRSYMFCTDGHVFQDPTCNRFDRGVTVAEMTASKIEDYEIRYFLSGFRRDRRTFTGSSGFVLDYYILPIRQLFDEYIYKLLVTGFSPQGAGSQDDYLEALNLGFEFFDGILATVEPGDYHLDEESGEFVRGESEDPEALKLNVPLGVGKYLEARTRSVGESEQVLHRGVELDKIGVLWAMSMRGYPAPKYRSASITLNYFDLLKGFTFDRFSSVMRDEYVVDIPVVPTEDGTLTPDDESPNAIPVKIRPSNSLSMQNYAKIFASAFYNNSGDRGYGDYVDFRVDGFDATFPEGTQTARFMTANGSRVLMAANTADGLGISFAIAAEAEARGQEMELLLEQMAQIPDATAMVDEIVGLFAQAWEIAEGAPMADNIVAALTSDLAGYEDPIFGLLADWVASADEETVEVLTGLQTQIAEAFAVYKGIADAESEITSEIDSIKRDLSKAEADLEEMKEIYEAFY